MTDAHNHNAKIARNSGVSELRKALKHSRQDTLAVFALYEAALPELHVPFGPTLNPPLWELGHIGWFQEYWLARNPQRALGMRADPHATRFPAVQSNADALYNSSVVLQTSRWNLPLPDAIATRAYLGTQLQSTLNLLDTLSDNPSEENLYFFRLALHHEDMHHEAALYMAQAQGIAVSDDRWKVPVLPAPGASLCLPAALWRLGVQENCARGFAFDNEYGKLEQQISIFNLDTQVVRWKDYLPFVEANGYEQPAYWSDAGRAWLTKLDARGDALGPRYLRRTDIGWERIRNGRWGVLNLEEPACHLCWYEADAWCRWAGRRLPTEIEWDYAVSQAGPQFRWGDVWEWTASAFSPFPGFVAHPYRDYSEPWFDGRPVLRGASFMTQPRMRHPRYRNFFERHRNDVPAGFRSCASLLACAVKRTSEPGK